ncbi:unnamed protein product [Gadus morhua 'NCC']
MRPDAPGTTAGLREPPEPRREEGGADCHQRSAGRGPWAAQQDARTSGHQEARTPGSQDTQQEARKPDPQRARDAKTQVFNMLGLNVEVFNLSELNMVELNMSEFNMVELTMSEFKLGAECALNTEPLVSCAAATAAVSQQLEVL